MTMRMLIDARHPEETRVAVAKGNRIEEFDFESEEHKQLKGNIYLAKVTRVEPSLQAAFIEYGGNRHGFLAFSEIHPDYYQIPKSDREALLREEAEHAAEEERLRAAADDLEPMDDHHGDDDRMDDFDEHSDEQDGEIGTGSSRTPVDESAADELRRKRQALRRRYKIQDVIQRRQVLLVQVVKEERGNKGAALTTYLSLAGRYCVLMPNTSHGGGISRKISNGADRKRLKSIMADLQLPRSMGLIVRTAGLQRTKTEIKRDFDYLARLWDEIRERTLGSAAPALIYRDSDLVKRAIRDLYHRDIDEVLVEGDEGFKAARGFMKLLMPSHVRRVQQHTEPTPIFQRYGVEDQLNAMYQPVVQLKSGGYLVINPTEALVSIDINSGRATREHNIEQTATATNLEAAAEIARQLRLRDMAGLVVIDFIDMEQGSHVRKVEKAMKDALKNDRARIQVGRISSFGLMEMSRQRLRTGVLEASTKTCPHCEGTGLMRTASSAGLSALRIVEDEAARGRGERICLRAGREAAIYVLNKKRAELADIEDRYGVIVEVLVDESFEGARMTVESSGPRPVAQPRPVIAPVATEGDDLNFDDDDDLEEAVEDDETGGDAEPEQRRDRTERSEEGDRNGLRRRRRRRRGGRGRTRREDEESGNGDTQPQPEEGDDVENVESGPVVADTEFEPAADGESEERARRSRRGRRGGRRRHGEESGGERTAGPVDDTDTVGAAHAAPAPDDAPMKEPVPSVDPSPDAVEAPAEDKPKARRRPRARKTPEPVEAVAADEAPAIEAAVSPAGTKEPVADSKPKRRSRAKKPVEPNPALDTEGQTTMAEETARAVGSDDAQETELSPAADNDGGPGGEGGSARRGWWQRTFG